MDSAPVIGTSLPLTLPKTSGGEVSAAREGFDAVLNSTVQQVNQKEHEGNMAIQQLHTGEAKNLHEVMIAVEEADMSVRMLVQMRNKALEAYNTIMRLQV